MRAHKNLTEEYLPILLSSLNLRLGKRHYVCPEFSSGGYIGNNDVDNRDKKGKGLRDKRKGKGKR
jgi:hypothetical protein